jgi:SAM-dependent methyltransferase
LSDVSASRNLTGERTLPNIWHENYWFRRHEAAYRMLAPLISRAGSPQLLLDAGSGEGYGAALLAGTTGARVVGLDYDLPSLRDARRHYSGVSGVGANLVTMPFRADSFDAVTSLQVIEHLWDQPGFIRECSRVSRPGAPIVVTTPNRLTFSPGLGRGEKPLNPFHANEFDAAELVDLLHGTNLTETRILGLHHGPRLADWESTAGSIVSAQLAQPYASWPHDLAELVVSITAEDFQLSETGLEASLDLIAIAYAGAIYA